MEVKNTTVVIPHYPIPGADELLKQCVDSLDYTELIVVVNEGTGFGKAVNQGLKLAKGEYIAIINNDVKLTQGALKQLCHPNKVMSPVWGSPVKAIGIDFLSNCFVFPRWVYEKVGGFDEQFKIGDYEDNDWYERCKVAGVEFGHNPYVRIYGEQGFTKSKMQYKPDENRELFFKKWGFYPKPIQEHYY